MSKIRLNPWQRAIAATAFTFTVIVVCIILVHHHSTGEWPDRNQVVKISVTSIGLALAAVAFILFATTTLHFLNNLPSRKAKNKLRLLRENRCPVCGYDMRGSLSRCPECGSPYDDLAAKLLASLPPRPKKNALATILEAAPPQNSSNYTQYSQRVRECIGLANHAARRAHAFQIDIGHLASALLQALGVAEFLLRRNGLNTYFANSQHPALSLNAPEARFRLDFSPEVRALFEDAIFHAQLLGDDFVGTEHLALAFLNLPPDRIASSLGPTAPSRRSFAIAVLSFRADLHQTNNQLSDAIHCLRRLCNIDPSSAQILNQLAWILATTPDSQLRNPTEAFPLALKANELTNFSDAAFLDTLATCHAALENFPEAIRLQTLALEKCPEAEKSLYQASLTLFQSHQPYLELPEKT